MMHICNLTDEINGGGKMIDPRVCENPIVMFRMKNKDGTWLFSEAECLRRIEVMLDRAKTIWLEELALERKGKPA